MATLGQDVKYAARTLARAPGFVAVVILTLAVGIGATTAIFSVVRGVLLRPLAYTEPDRLVRIYDWWTQFKRGSVSVPELVDYRTQSQTVESLAAFTSDSENLTGDGEPARVSVGLGQANYFDVLGVPTALGRGFAADEDQPGKQHVVLLTDQFWRSRYNADRGVVGKSVRLDNVPYVVVGILPAYYSCPRGCDLWRPLAFAPERYSEDRRGNHNLAVVARLKPGVTVEQTQADFDRIGNMMRSLHPVNYPADSGWKPIIVPLLDQIVGDVRPSLWLLVGASALVLLIACANVAGLLLARGATRVREMTLRAALGAGRGRLIRQLLTESVGLSLIGGFAGFLLALWGVDLLLALAPTNLPRMNEVKVDGLVLAFSFGLTALTGVLFGLLPALQASRVDLHDALRAGTRVSSGKRPRRLRRGLVVAEVALAIVLVTGAGLVTRSFANVLSVDAGFPTDRLLTLKVSLPSPNYQPTKDDLARFHRYFSEAVDRLARLPGVRSSGAIDVLPFEAYGSDTSFEIEGQKTPPGAMPPDEEIRVVLPGTFEALGVPLIAGRLITKADADGAMRVMMVNQAFAKKYWKDGDAVGKRINIDDPKDPKWTTIVGVVGNVHAFGLDAEVRAEMYFPLAQALYAGGSFSLLVRSAIPEAQLVRSVRAELLAIDPDQPVYDMKPMITVVGQSLERRRFVLVLFEIFGGLALTLAAVGLYGVMAHSVAQRTQEIGVRMALGARRAHIVGLVAREGAFLTAGGLLIGIAVALAVSRLLAGMLYEVSPNDPLALIAAGVLLGAAAALATAVPVRRAMRVDPMKALRDE